MTADRDTRRTLAQAATPGPWTATTREVDWGDPEVRAGIGNLIASGRGRCAAWFKQRADAAHIAASDPAQILADLDALDRLEAERDALRAAEGAERERCLAIVAKWMDADKRSHSPERLCTLISADIRAALTEGASDG